MNKFDGWWAIIFAIHLRLLNIVHLSWSWQDLFNICVLSGSAINILSYHEIFLWIRNKDKHSSIWFEKVWTSIYESHSSYSAKILVMYICHINTKRSGSTLKRRLLWGTQLAVIIPHISPLLIKMDIDIGHHDAFTRSTFWTLSWKWL